ncbi:hypothetical protein [Pelagibacterium luteolum]|uniref:Uncharacterized protein n=1 Tax=Pelagibacterium luteolum TaxID=440168 RepID=A0A1G7ZGS6_9HYPH|nr:hypothetical protein [Pelagibacterium luteolum]SDH07787.1 hypothetical protein SAMN04487974_1202 [Pelagibacterium luteolum]
MSEQLDKIYSLAEAAERLRLNKNALARLGRRTGNCSVTGRTVLFSEADLLAIWQEMRAPRSSRALRTIHEGIKTREVSSFLFSRPLVPLDRRTVVILRWLATQKRPKTFADIDRCGPRTIEDLLGKGFVVDRGKDPAGHKLVVISPAGRDALKKVDRWKRERQSKGRSSDF